MVNKTILISALALMYATGCSSIVSKSDYAVAINSAPAGADFVVKNSKGLQIGSGVTPSTVMLKASAGFFVGEEYVVTFSKEGFNNQTYTISSSVDGWYFGNVLVGGLIGLLIIDPATGAMFKLPERVDIALNDKSDSLTIMTTDSLTEEQKSVLIPL